MGFTACVFCGATGATVKITNEHLYSAWTNSVLPSSVVGPDITVERTDNICGEPRTRPVKKLAVEQVHCVCEPCNNGWGGDATSGDVRWRLPRSQSEPVG